MASEAEKCQSHSVVRVCAYYVEKKKRFCKMTVGVGCTYCGEHIAYETTKVNHERIPCPYDSRHSCYAHLLKKHVKKCNSKPTELPGYISKGINKGCIIEIPSLRLADVYVDELKTLLDKIENVYKGLDDKINEEFLEHSILEDAIKDPKCGFNSKKHLIQSSSLIAHLHMLGLTANMSIMEFGAGKGKLTYWIAKSLPQLEGYTFILIDRSTLRHKSENKIKELVGENVHRFRADIADLKLSCLPPLINSGKCAAVSKHLCGAGTDLALRCLVNGREAAENLTVMGIVVAVCCHHRCDWASFTGKEFFNECGFEPSEFSVMCGIASWATSGVGRRKHKNAEQYCERVTMERKGRIQLSSSERAAYGKMVKELIDHGRRKYLEKNGFSCALKYYVQHEISPENVCLLAKLKI